MMAGSWDDEPVLTLIERANDVRDIANDINQDAYELALSDLIAAFVDLAGIVADLAIEQAKSAHIVAATARITA